ncbi:MAG: TRAP transporter large permease subunit [Oscillospiraceae bacterium]
MHAVNACYSWIVRAVPEAASLGTAVYSGHWIADSSIPLQIVPQQMFSAVNSFSLLCVPFFLLAGTLMEEGGLTDKLVDFANALIGG